MSLSQPETRPHSPSGVASACGNHLRPLWKALLSQGWLVLLRLILYIIVYCMTVLIFYWFSNHEVS